MGARASKTLEALKNFGFYSACDVQAQEDSEQKMTRSDDLRLTTMLSPVCRVPGWEPEDQ